VVSVVLLHADAAITYKLVRLLAMRRIERLLAMKRLARQLVMRRWRRG
jgi:hypothetical protein